MVNGVGHWQEIGPGCWARTIRDGGSNVGLIVGEHSCMLVDVGFTLEQGRDLAQSVTEVTDVPLRHAVITHHHGESWFGLAAILDVESHAHAGIVDYLSGPEAQKCGILPVAPTHTFNLADVVDLGGRSVELIHSGPAHSATDVWVNVPDARVLYAGDLVTEGEDPYPGEDSDVGNWAKTLDLLVGSTHPDAVIVPGDGEIVDQDYVAKMAADMYAVLGQTKMLIQGGMTREEAEPIGGWPYTERLTALLDAAWKHHIGKGVRQQFPLTPRT